MFTKALTAALLATSALAAPLVTRDETWTITQLDLHFIGSNTGLPGGAWTNSTAFPTTLDLTVKFADSTSASLHTSWWSYPSSEIPTTPIAGDNGLSITLSPAADGHFSDAQFTLAVQRKLVDASTGAVHSYAASQNVISDDTPAGSIITCLGGAPMTGITCHLGGMLAVPGPVTLQATQQS